MLSLKESRAVADMAELLYDFLPGAGDEKWKGHVSFKTVAADVGVERFWEPGSKMPMITSLLGRTLDHQRSTFERLILEIVRCGMVYRQKKGIPIRRTDIERLNGLLIEVGFKFPDLWDSAFLQALEKDGATRAAEHVDRLVQERALRATEQSARSAEIESLKQDFYALHQMQPQPAGLAFERILNRLFELFGLAPREPFRVVGEQIDGSFDLDYETYLVEAKWEKEHLSEAPLLVFRGKIEGKSAFTRGVFIALNGITQQAKEAITRGKTPTFFVLDGHNLVMVLSGAIGLTELLRARQRLLAEEGAVVVPYNEIEAGSRRALRHD